MGGTAMLCELYAKRAIHTHTHTHTHTNTHTHTYHGGELDGVEVLGEFVDIRAVGGGGRDLGCEAIARQLGCTPGE
jgi:hypothetical protein